MSLSLSKIIASHFKIIFYKVYQLLPKLVFLFTSLFLTLLLVDLALRKFNYPYFGCENVGQVLETYFGSFDSQTGWSYNPSTSYYGIYGGIEHHFDANGNRARSANWSSDSKKQKIVFIGDSVTFGTGLSFEESFVAQIEENLNQKYDIELQVINLGVQGYGTDQALIKLQQQITQLNPLVVVYTFIPDHLYLRNLNYNRRLHFKCLEFEGTKPLYKLDHDQLYLEKLPQTYQKYDRFPVVSLFKDATDLLWEKRVSKTDYAFDLTNALLSEIERTSQNVEAKNYFIFYDNSNNVQANFNNEQISNRLFKEKSRKVLDYFGWSTNPKLDFISEEDGIHPSSTSSANLAKKFVEVFGDEINQLVLENKGK